MRVTAFASLSSQPITTDLAAIVLKDNVSDSAATEITAALIQSETAQYFNVTIEALCSASRSRSLTEARQIAMYLCRELTDLSLPAIGGHFGGRDHTTVIHANRKIAEKMSSKPEVYNDITELTSRIRAAARSK
ncbi:helix-turn-helix domain-containing protein [Nanchangia anserum]|uniref:helix-turn-helix domain-containing protein n=1 Tax=Nanchangia anserum TaxID=2692125 RepID=UPI0030B82DB5